MPAGPLCSRSRTFLPGDKFITDVVRAKTVRQRGWFAYVHMWNESSTLTHISRSVERVEKTPIWILKCLGIMKSTGVDEGFFFHVASISLWGGQSQCECRCLCVNTFFVSFFSLQTSMGWKTAIFIELLDKSSHIVVYIFSSIICVLIFGVAWIFSIPFFVHKHQHWNGIHLVSQCKQNAHKRALHVHLCFNGPWPEVLTGCSYILQLTTAFSTDSVGRSIYDDRICVLILVWVSVATAL